jgi:hypothetical protein
MTRSRWVLGLLVAGLALRRYCADDAAPPSPPRLQAAVLTDGFAVLEGSAGDHHVLGYDDDGQRRFRRAVPLGAPDVRAAGTSAGPAVAWLDGAKLKVALVPSDGQLGDASSWGKAVRQQCDGVASNEHRFGFGWLDKDNRVWFVHGPVSRTRAVESAEITEIEPAGKVTWCGVASAHHDVVLLWREGSSTFANFCTKKSCSGLSFKLPIDPRSTLRGFGCTKDNCALAVRDAGGTTHLGWIGPTGKVAWWKQLSDVEDGAFSIVGAGDRAIVVGYLTSSGATAVRYLASGSSERAWHDPGATGAPSLAWARDRLFVAHRHGDAIAPDVVPLPR